MLHLLKKSYEAYEEGGFEMFFYRVVRYLYKSYILFSSYPTMSVQSPERRISTYRNKYLIDEGGFNIAPIASDTVIEAGAYHGSDTATFARLAKQVIAFEPSPRNYETAKDNLESFDNVTLVNAGLWKEPDHLEIKYAKEGHDDGFLQPDRDEVETASEDIPVTTVENYVEKSTIEAVDFLKIEAEGAETEIIEGIGDLQIRNIVVNCDEERGGEPNGREVCQLLQPLGYELVGMKRGHILFFTLDTVPHSAFRSVFS